MGFARLGAPGVIDGMGFEGSFEGWTAGNRSS